MASQDRMLTQHHSSKAPLPSGFWESRDKVERPPPLPPPPQLVADGFSLPFIDEKTESFHMKRPIVKGEGQGGIPSRPPSPSPGC